MAATLPKASRRGLGDEAADVVREAILAGHFPPGSALREVDLAADLDISRGSVRDGLAVLEREGLVRSGWHRGTTVIELRPGDVDEVYALRGALDALAATTARARRTAADLDDLAGLVAAMHDECSGGRRGGPARVDVRRLVALDIAFHDRIYTAAGNARLGTAWRAIRSQVHLFQVRRAERGAEHYRARVVDEHHELVGLLRDGEPATLARRAGEHVETARRALLDDLAHATPGSSPGGTG